MDKTNLILRKLLRKTRSYIDTIILDIFSLHIHNLENPYDVMIAFLQEMITENTIKTGIKLEKKKTIIQTEIINKTNKSLLNNAQFTQHLWLCAHFSLASVNLVVQRSNLRHKAVLPD